MRLLFIIVGPYKSDTAFSARYAEEALFVIESGLCEVRTGTEETGEHRALRMIDLNVDCRYLRSVVRLATCDISMMIVTKCVGSDAEVSLDCIHWKVFTN
jgi:hypothetical protein